MAKEASANLEIPAEMRAFAEKSVEQAKQAFDTFISAAQQAVNTAANQAASARTGAKEANELAMRFAERNVASSFEFAQRRSCTPRISRTRNYSRRASLRMSSISIGNTRALGTCA